MYSDQDFGPCVMVTCFMEHQVGGANGVHKEVLPPELRGNAVLLPVGPIFMLHIHGTHRGVVADLWGGGREGGGEM